MFCSVGTSKQIHIVIASLFFKNEVAPQGGFKFYYIRLFIISYFFYKNYEKCETTVNVEFIKGHSLIGHLPSGMFMVICRLFKKWSSYENAVKLEKLEDHHFFDNYLSNLINFSLK